MGRVIDTLVEDIYDTLEKGVDVPDEVVDKFAHNLAGLLKERLKERSKEFYLRMSNIGVPDRKLWFDSRHPDVRDKDGPTKLKFLYGDIIESLLLFLAEVSGHSVTHQQEEVELDGVVGHCDAVIDGYVTDVKSASKWSFKKFTSGKIKDDDPFGYIDQLSGYSKALGLPGAFLVMNKETGELCLYKPEDLEYLAELVPARIEHIKSVLEESEPPEEKCYPPVPMGTSGNMQLNTNCTYCSHKFVCWADANQGTGLRAFEYASGLVYLTDVVKQPNVIESFPIYKE